MAWPVSVGGVGGGEHAGRFRLRGAGQGMLGDEGSEEVACREDIMQA